MGLRPMDFLANYNFRPLSLRYSATGILFVVGISLCRSVLAIGVMRPVSVPLRNHLQTLFCECPAIAGFQKRLERIRPAMVFERQIGLHLPGSELVRVN